ncbi:MAG: hypothetical protein V9F04_10315 [Dermatophilaceae bacterium]
MAEAGATPAQEIAFTLANAQGICPSGASRPGWTSTTSPRGCRSSSSPARRSWKRSRSSGRPAGSGRGS